jgi:UDP-N-acetylmuramate dehydrogenase
VTTTFAELTTLRVGGPVGALLAPRTTAEVIDGLRSAMAGPDPLLVMGGGSNLVVGDIGWPGPVLRMATTEVDIDGERVTAAAGVDWDELVQATLAQGLAGLEALSGIPGSVGGTPVQNVGAYGALTSEVLESVSVFDRETGTVEQWEPQRCDFGPHRQSVFKHTDRFVILDVTYRLRRGDQSAPIRYAELARRLEVDLGGTAAPGDVRAAVLTLRRGKAMVLDPADHDTWSVGSFFLNPVLPRVPPAAHDCPQWPDPEGTKLSAGWLIQHAGFPPGYGADWSNGTVGLSSRHALAVTNRGGATAADIMKFAAHIRDGVQARFDIRLNPECHLVNCAF